MRRAGLAAALALAACQCDESPVGVLSPRVEIAPSSLDLGTVALGVRAQGVLTLRNLGTAPLTIDATRLEGAAFFSIAGEAPPPALAPGSSVAIVIAARPDVLGAHTATLTIDHDDAPRAPTRVPVRLRAVEPPPCDDGNPCTADLFDTELQRCTHGFEDGIPCQPADRCVIDASCVEGVCLGRAKVCSDTSPCTRDVCRQIDGECRFLEDASACDDGNPCTTDLCGPEGCSHGLVANATPCDDHDGCTSGDACFGGVCLGTGSADGERCDDGDSCTTDDVCRGGRCEGVDLIASRAEGERVFERPLIRWEGAFLHRREVSMTEDDVFVGMDHLPLVDPPSLSHVIFAMKQCGTPYYEFSYRPPDGHVFVSFVRREMQLSPAGELRIVVGIRQTRDQGYIPQTTSYRLDPRGRVLESKIQVVGGETGRSLLPDGSHIFGTLWPLQSGPLDPQTEALTNLIVVREDSFGNVLWKHERSSGDWAEFLGTAGPRVLFWASDSWGALDFNTGALVWSSPTPFIADQMALSTRLNLGLARVGVTGEFDVAVPTQLVGVELLGGRQVFVFPPVEDPRYVPRSDPVISADGRIIVIMQRATEAVDGGLSPSGLDYVELSATGEVLAQVPLPYAFPAEGFPATRSIDRGDDPSPTVADDGITYVGYGTELWAIEPGGALRWTLSSTYADAFTGTVPLLRADGVLLVSESSRKIIGVRTNGGRMSADGWASFRHDNRRTNFTP